MIRRRDKKEGVVPRDYWDQTWTSPWTMLSDMDRVFDDFRSEWESLFLVPRAQGAAAVRQPLVDLADNGKEYLVKAEIPGISKEGLKIEVTQDSLEISGETDVEEKEEDEEAGYIRRERRYSMFHRTLPLPENVLTDKVEAELKDGVLTVKLPKAAPPEKKSKKVPVK
ncbi:MAG: Hsp20/alpha crystallin family protein [Candidatus Thermoplasmatota archaeon]